MILSYRVPMPHWLEDAPFRRLAELLARHRPAVDEVSLRIGSTGHGYKPLGPFREQAAIAAERIAWLHANGVGSVGINVLSTLGHGDDAGDPAPLPFQPMVGHDGQLSISCPCPNTPQFRAYIRDKYRLVAGARPDFILVDDDLRLTRHGVLYACFCPNCLAKFGMASGDREALVARLNDPAAHELREDWVAFNAATLEELCAEIAAAVHEVDPALDVGLMTAGPSLSTYSGQALGAWITALSGRRAQPGHGFSEDSHPFGQLRKALDVGRQVRALPGTVDNIQYGLTSAPYTDLEKADQTMLNECALALATGCNGIAFAILRSRPGNLDDLDARLRAIARARPHWEALAAAAEGTRRVGVWPVDHDRLMARRAVTQGVAARRDGWFWEGAPYDITAADPLAALGVPFTPERDNACATLLMGRVAEALTNDALRRILSGGVLLDAPSLQVLWERGLGELAGVRLCGRYDAAVWERFTEHPFNAPYAGDARATALESAPAKGDATPAWTLEPLDALAPNAASESPVAALSHLMRPDGADCGPCVTAYENPLGGRVVVSTYSPWTHLGTRAKWTQLQAALRWASRDRLPLRMDRLLPVAPFLRLSDDGARFVAVLLNASYDPTASLELFVRARSTEVTLYTGGIDIPLRVEPAPDGVTFTVPGVAPWSTVTLVGS